MNEQTVATAAASVVRDEGTGPAVVAPAGSLVRWSWAFFDWAQQPYYTLVAAFIFRPYFVAEVAASPEDGQVLIGYAGAAAGAAVAVLGPLVGAAVDGQRNPKAWLAITSIPFVLSCAALWWAAPGDASTVPFIIGCLIVAGIFAEITTTVNNAMLPAIAVPGRLGRLSGDAVALGYLGGIVCAVLILGTVLLPAQPMFGLDKAAHEPDRIVGPFAALWYVVFLVPLFLFFPADARAKARGRPFAELWSLIRTLPSRPAMLRFLAGRLLIADALGAASLFAGILASSIFSWGTAELAVFGLLLIIFSGIGALAGGRMDDRWSAKLGVLATLVILAVGVAGTGLVTADSVFFVPVAPPVQGDGLFATIGERMFLAFGAMIGLAAGPLISSMRSWMAALSPAGEAGRWFGLYAFAGRATAFVAPLMVSIATLVTGEVRSAIAVILAFLLAGLVVLAAVPARTATG